MQIINNNFQPGIIRNVGIEVALNQRGFNNFPDQSQLRGAIITSIEVVPSSVASKSIVSGNSTVATDADLKATTVTLVRLSDNVVQNLPILALNDYQVPGSTLPYKQVRELFYNQIIDWNQCQLTLNDTPSTTGAIVSLSVYYYYPAN